MIEASLLTHKTAGERDYREWRTERVNMLPDSNMTHLLQQNTPSSSIQMKNWKNQLSIFVRKQTIINTWLQ